jgi:hypothetical protein
MMFSQPTGHSHNSAVTRHRFGLLPQKSADKSARSKVRHESWLLVADFDISRMS